MREKYVDCRARERKRWNECEIEIAQITTK